MFLPGVDTIQWFYTVRVQLFNTPFSYSLCLSQLTCRSHSIPRPFLSALCPFTLPRGKEEIGENSHGGSCTVTQ